MPRGIISSAQVSLLGFSGDHVLALLKPCIEQLGNFLSSNIFNFPIFT